MSRLVGWTVIGALASCALGAEEPCPEEESHSEIDEEAATRSTVIIILTALIACTLIFEFIKDKITEKVKGELQPIVDSMWKELTILGFLGVVSFLVQKAGALSRLSCRVFGTPDDIPENLENIHMLLFLVMIIFLLQVLLLAFLSNRIAKRWKSLEQACQEDITKVYQNFMTADPPCCIPTLLRNKQRHDVEVMEYCLMRDGFISSHSKIGSSGGDFNLAEYFTHILGEEVGELVEVSLITWVALEIVFVLSFAYFHINDDVARIMGVIGLAYLGLIGLIVVGRKMDKIYYHLLPNMKRIRIELKRCGMNIGHQHVINDDDEEQALNISHAVKETARLLASQMASVASPVALPREARQPHYVGQHMPERGACARALCGKAANRQERLFWWEKHGPRLLFLIMQFAMVLTSVYVAVFAFFVATVVSHDGDFDTGLKVILIIGGCIPVLIIVFDVMPFLIRRHVEITHIEMLKDDIVIKKVIRQLKTRKALRAMKLLHMISWTEERKKQRNGELSAGPPQEEFTEKEMDSFREMFATHDSDSSGSVDQKELKEVFEALGHPIDDAMLKLMFETVDESGDGAVDFNEFVEMMRGYSRINKMEPEECVDVLFSMFDKDHSGSISIDEFVTAVNSLGDKNFSLHDVQEMVREIDENGDGEIDKEEFAVLMRRYHTISD